MTQVLAANRTLEIRHVALVMAEQAEALGRVGPTDIQRVIARAEVYLDFILGTKDAATLEAARALAKTFTS